MLPLLYETTSRIISTNSMHYLGRITDCTSCVAAETLNGDYLLTVEVKPTDALYTTITVQQFIQVKPNPFDQPQFFEIYEINRTADGNLTIKAKHIKHCAYNNLMSAGYTNDLWETPQELWEQAAENPVFANNFIFYSDITDTATGFETGLRKIGTFGDFFAELLLKFVGEYHYDNFNVEFLKNRGSKKQYVLRWGANISSMEQTLSTEDIKSHIIGVATVHDTYKNEDMQLMCEPYEIVGQQSKTNKLLIVDASWLVDDITVNSNTGENFGFVQNACRVAATTHYKDSKPAEIKINITTDFRAELDEMQEIGLADTIDVIIDDKNTTATAKVSKVEFDCLLERWDNLELGTIKTKLSNYF